MFKAEMSDDGGKSFASNQLRFRTKEEAERYASDLFSRWTAATDYRIAETDDNPDDYDERGYPKK